VGCFHLGGETLAFTDTDPRFQRELTALAERHGKPVLAVYDWWREYSKQCDGFDQSPVLSEFEQWHESRLKGGAK
jgi:hypothetical protein